MTSERGLTTISEVGSGQVGIFNPDAQLDMAIMAAKALGRVISQKKKPVIINGEQYLEFEDWQTLGQFDGVSVRTGDAELVEIDGIKGAKAKAYLVNNKTGEIIGGAEAYCMRDEEKWGIRPKYEYHDNKRVNVGNELVPWFQLASMAQTRAGSKALRNKEAWIAVLAGYKPTPAEEMTGNETPTAEHWCKEHNTAFFMRGKMKSFAHPIGDTGEWCHEHKEDPAKKSGQEATDAWLDDPPQAKSVSVGDIPKDSLEIQRDDMFNYIAEKKGWKNTKTARSWIVNACKIEDKRIDTEPQKVLQEVKELNDWKD